MGVQVQINSSGRKAEWGLFRNKSVSKQKERQGFVYRTALLTCAIKWQILALIMSWISSQLGWSFNFWNSLAFQPCQKGVRIKKKCQMDPSKDKEIFNCWMHEAEVFFYFSVLPDEHCVGEKVMLSICACSLNRGVLPCLVMEGSPLCTCANIPENRVCVGLCVCLCVV